MDEQPLSRPCQNPFKLVMDRFERRHQWQYQGVTAILDTSERRKYLDGSERDYN